VQKKVDEVNRRVSSTESIRKFAILDHDLEIAKDEITPTGKVKRDVVTRRYAKLIEELYA
jgi:long-chain acyl-CoA synthetase